ncbi:MAG TPA: hypothetical protein VKT49_09340 [Bryobacteraceae bacterium]|nr:hypothetical protein [Bryobacteraceae bacterium]
MFRHSWKILLLAASSLVWGQLPLEPRHESGAGVTGAFEGWFKNPDGSFSLLLGYFNRNTDQELDVPIGPNNRIEPGGPDQGQPTHFLPGRQWGLFAIKVPADFGDKKLTWTLVANGQTMVIPADLKNDYEISPFEEAAVHNTPPILSFDEHGIGVQGPQGLTVNRTAKVGVPLQLTIFPSDDAKLTTSSGAPPRNLGGPVMLTWSKYRGPGAVKFSNAKPAVEKIERKDIHEAFTGKSTTTATFTEPGEYVLNVTANDYSGEGGGGFQCCWTTAKVKVTVQP